MNADSAGREGTSACGRIPAKHGQLTQKIIGVFFDVYNELGSGFLESVYQHAMALALEDSGLRCEREAVVDVLFRGRVAGSFRADLVIEGVILLELKAARSIEEVFERQLLNYLRATDLEVGLLLNFGPRPQFRRLVFANDRKRQRSIRVHPRESAARNRARGAPEPRGELPRAERG